MRFNLYRIPRCNTLHFFSLIVTTLALSLGSIVFGRSYAGASDSNQQPSSVIGRVTDEVGDPLAGVTVSIKGTSYAVSTDMEGHYRLEDVPADAIVTFSFSGMKYQEIAVSGQTSINVVMLPDVINMDEVVVVGYGTQKRATVTGSVASVQHAEIVQTKNENPLNTLTGRVPGLRVRQQNSEPGVFGTSIDIRGMGNPLVIIDGVPRDNIQRLDPNDIESISVLKDASAAIYGVQAANGVVLVTTKKGAADNTFNMDYSGSMIWQAMAGMPHTISAADYIRLTNELDMNRVNGDGTWRYSQELLDEFLSGERQSTNWNDAVFRNSAPQGQHNLSIASGNSRTQYFTSLGYQFQESFFNSDRGFDYDKFNLRANLTSKLTDDLTFDLKTNATTDQRNRTQFSSNDIIRATWRQISVDPIYANNTAPYYYHTTISEANNPVAWIDQDYVGYIRYQDRSFQSSASLNYQAPFLEGLGAEVFYSYDYNNNQEKNYSRAYEQFRYDESASTYDTYLMRSPSSIRRDFGEQMLSIYRFSLRYERTFNESHHINAVAVHEGRRQEGDGFYAFRQLRLDLDELFAGDADNQEAYMDPNQRYEYAYQSYIGRLNYDYKGRYLLEGALRADGSSRFPSNARWGFFPSASFGYRISEEGFWKNSFLDIVNNLKLRASYGRMGDDSGLNYQFVSGYSYPATATFFGGNFINGAASTGIPNLGITWMESDMFNAGLDMEMWDGMLGVTFDVFRRNRSGMYAYRGDVSSIIGALLPQENLNSDRTDGYELALNHRGTVGNVSYTIGGNLALTRISNRTVVRADDRSYYHNWRNNPQNRYTNIWWGMEAGGQYRSFAEIAEFPVYSSRNELPGNYYHEDWNGDGIIDDMDRHPMGFGPQPLLNYGITGSLSYKGLDFFMLWQGAGMANVYYNEILRQPLWSGYDNTHDRFLDRWRPVDPHANPYDQQTEFIEGRYPMPGSPYPGSESEFSVYNNRYIRLKNAELGYTLPATAIRWVGIRSARISVGGYNLLTFSPVDFVDPEHPQDQGGYMYPLNRTYNVSLSCKF